MEPRRRPCAWHFAFLLDPTARATGTVGAILRKSERDAGRPAHGKEDSNNGGIDAEPHLHDGRRD
jgi:hypothetical protein